MQLMPQANTKTQNVGIKENCLHQARILPAFFQIAASPKTAGSGLHDQHFPVLNFISQHSEQRGSSARAEALNFKEIKKLLFHFNFVDNMGNAVISLSFLVVRICKTPRAESFLASAMSISASTGKISGACIQCISGSLWTGYYLITSKIRVVWKIMGNSPFPSYFPLSEGMSPRRWIKTSPHSNVNKPFSGGQRALVQVNISLWFVPLCAVKCHWLRPFTIQLVKSIRGETGWDQQTCCCPQMGSGIHPAQWLPVRAHRSC